MMMCPPYVHPVSTLKMSRVDTISVLLCIGLCVCVHPSTLISTLTPSCFFPVSVFSFFVWCHSSFKKGWTGGHHSCNRPYNKVLSASTLPVLRVDTGWTQGGRRVDTPGVKVL